MTTTTPATNTYIHMYVDMYVLTKYALMDDGRSKQMKTKTDKQNTTNAT